MAQLVCVAVATLVADHPAQAGPTTINNPSITLWHSGANDVNFFGGVEAYDLRIRSESVFPGAPPGVTPNYVVDPVTGGAIDQNTGLLTLGLATTTNTVTNQTVSRRIFFSPATTGLNAFDRFLPISPNAPSDPTHPDHGLLGTWTETFATCAGCGYNTLPSTPGDFSTRTVTLPPGTDFLPFVTNVTVTGTKFQPIFSWSPPVRGEVNGYRINLIDRDHPRPRGGIGADVIYSASCPAPSCPIVPGSPFDLAHPQIQVPDKIPLLNNAPLDPTHHYSVEIGALQKRDPQSASLGNPNIISRSAAYFSFTPVDDDSPPLILPTRTIEGIFQYGISVNGGTIYYIDPPVAVGYDYQIGAGDPNFLSVTLPSNIGDGKYDIYEMINNVWTLVAHDFVGGSSPFSFGPNGTDQFRILGIETSVNLDPNSATAFPTGVIFTGSGQFTGTQTPITRLVTDVPEPATLLLLGTGLAGLYLARRRRVA